jgi:nickel-dependent lactate racemase
LINTLHPIEEIAASIRLPDDQLVRLTRESNVEHQNKSEQLTDPAALVRRALDEPLDFPPLAAAIVPGDRVAIAVDEGLPCVGAIVRGAVEAFEKAGVDPTSISIVTMDGETSRLCREELASHSARLPQFVVHDPEDAENLCMFGINKLKEPLQVNRTVFDADIVLPIGSARADGRSAYGCLFPSFSNAEVIASYRTPENLTSPDDVTKKAEEAEEAGWLIGALMAVQVVPGAAETVAHVVAGEPRAVARRCDQLYTEQWSFVSPRQVSLVIANISGGAEAQTWQNVGRALTVAENLLAEGGAIAICSNLEMPPGESLSRLMRIADLEKAARKILRADAADSVPAWHVVRALQRGPVYFLSQLEADTVEDLGLAPIANLGELARLASRHESCVVIDDAQYAIVNME